AEALPIVDYTINMVTAKLDLTTARDKSLASNKLLPIIAEMKDNIRRDHYLNKLAKLTETSYRNMEAALSKIKPYRRAKEPKQEAIAQALHPVFFSPVEEYCLALLLQHPELKAHDQGPSPEYFENSENREILIAWQQANDLPSLKEKLDAAIWEHLDSLINKSLPANQIERKYANCVLRLQERFLRSLEAKREAVLALEAESGGTAAELAKLEEQGIEVSAQLGEVFIQEARGSGAKEVGK
ncbi:MAG: hypothetical protein KAW00_07100, partial [Dehalococcoidia bacterium]|nr:hypothetical protein [Dehalococcoidia bacterium]